MTFPAITQPNNQFCVEGGVKYVSKSSVWTRAHTDPRVDIRDFGNVGAADHTTMIEEAALYATTNYKTLFISDDVAWTYSGTGIDLSSAPVPGIIHWEGVSTFSSLINVTSDTYLINHASQLWTCNFEKFTCRGGKGFLNNTWTGTASGQSKKTFRDVRIDLYSECAVSSDAADCPWWIFEGCEFFANDYNNTMGIALPDLANNTSIEDCIFGNQAYGVKARNGGEDVHINNTTFLNFGAPPSTPRAKVWFVPRGSGIAGDPRGRSATITDSKFGNEGYIQGSDLHILYSDEVGGQNGTSLPTYAASTGVIAGHHYSANKIQQGGPVGTSDPFVRSYTPNVSELSIYSNAYEGTPPSTLVEVVGGTDITQEQFTMYDSVTNTFAIRQ